MTVRPRVETVPIQSVEARAYRIPTDQPEESDGTLEWNATTLVYVEIAAGDLTGIGYTYASSAAARVVQEILAGVLIGGDALQTAALNAKMYAGIRNNGRGGITAMAISPLDIALWDLKGKLLDAPVCSLLAQTRERVPIYGSGGFTSYSIAQLREQLAGWVHGMGIPRVKMKIGRDPQADPQRVAAARWAVGSDAELFVDANGAYAVKQALELARAFSDEGVTWYEEPVYHGDLRGNTQVREGVPPLMEVSNGEYGFAPQDFIRIIETGAADVVQADVTRCGGYSGFLEVDAICRAHRIPLSSHCAPYVTMSVASAATMLRHMEYFHDHVRIERMLFDGTADPQDGMLAPDRERPGIGLEFKRADAEAYAI